MSRNDGVSPLRINKTPNGSPSKGGAISRPLSEIGPTAQRRNSPSFNQSTKKMMFSKEPSPFGSSPFDKSPRLFWKEQTTSPGARFGSENEYMSDDPPSVLSPKRSSIENLKKASRVKNSSMFAREQKHEYDPASVQPLDRPLKAGRPLSTQVQGNAFGGSGLAGLRKQTDDIRGHRRGESLNSVPTRDSLSKIPNLSPTKSSPGKLPTMSSFASSPAPEDRPSPASPGKSALASPGRFNYPEYNADSSVYSDEDDMTAPTPRALRRGHAKSVTFDAAPPTINEYEMVTPDPSTVANSRCGSYDSQDEEDVDFDDGDSFDASLEDTEKTPVVLPEDWRNMSPEEADTSLVYTEDDVFDSREVSPLPAARPNGVPMAARAGSVTSDESRPLPPLPPLPGFLNEHHRRGSSPGISDAAERVSGTQRSLPSPPPAAGISKADLLNMRESSMSLDDRLRLMNIDFDRNTATPTQDMQDHQRDIRLGSPFRGDTEDMSETDEPKAPRISRESILRKVKSRNFDEYDSYDYDAESSPERSYGDLADLDPDVPIPSRECSSNFDELPRAAPVDRDEADSVLDAYETNGAYRDDETPRMEGYESEGSVVHHDKGYESDGSVVRHEIKQEPQDDDDASQYSTHPEEQPTSQSTIETSGPTTPAELTSSSPSAAEKDARRDELFSSFKDNDVDLSLDPLKSSFDTVLPPLDSTPKLDAMRDFLRRPETPTSDQEVKQEEPGTPDSVIRHPVGEETPVAKYAEDIPDVDVVEPSEASIADDSEASVEASEASVVVPEQFATIKGAGGKLKTRPSLLPEDIDMAATRRQVSGSHPPPVPVRSPKRQSLSLEVGHVKDWESQPSNGAGFMSKEDLILDIDIGEDDNDLSFGLDREFDNIIEAQKKGYLMRQNTKVVVASNRQFSDEVRQAEKAEKATPRKPSSERKPAWTTEPWNGKARRRSMRTASGQRRATNNGPAPPLPGQESAVAGGLDSVEEQGGEELEEGAERGRLFVKVVGVKDLDLPLPKTERTYFQLTLDNGLHCVTTSWLDLAHSAPIGQEFELVVLDDLEFQLTLQTKLEPPATPQVIPAVPVVKEVNHKKSSSGFRSFLSTPKKRKEAERKQQEEAQRLAEQQAREAQAQRVKPKTAWDLLHNLVGPDGSFARAYVCLKNHENEAYGRLLNVDIPCFNEWAVDDTGASSVKSKRGTVVRRPPYRVGKLALQLLYVPKPKNAKDEDMPKSMNACLRELKEAEQVKGKQWEGFLSQQGGDCPYWRRRFFRLDGTKLTAYHETTRQPRATISLAKATKLIDDKTALQQQPSSSKSGGRRKSAFAEDEEGYMFVEEGFRIRFANGEVIDFYADTTAQKEEWMTVLSETIGKDIAGSKAWTEMIFEKERKEKKRNQAPPPAGQPRAPPPAAQPRPQQQQRPQSYQGTGSKHVPTSPMKGRMPQSPHSSDAVPQMSGALKAPLQAAPAKGHSRTQSDLPPAQSSPTKGHSRTRSEIPPPIEKDPRHKAGMMPRKREVGEASRRDQVRSMMF